jgi:hypothetical protein
VRLVNVVKTNLRLLYMQTHVDAVERFTAAPTINGCPYLSFHYSSNFESEEDICVPLADVVGIPVSSKL